MAFFSIIIPTYNRAHMLPKAIESILAQSYTDWELIIIDDGSTDNTKEVVLSYGDERIKYIYQVNQERSAARNNGILNAKGKYMCFLDSDDYYLPERLNLLFKEIKARNEPVAMFYTGICYQKNNCVTERPELKNDFLNKYDFIVKAIIGVPQACIASEVFKKHRFNTKYRIGEDMELWLRIVNEFPLIYLSHQYTIVATDHEDRSVNERKFNPGKEQLNMLKYIFRKGHPGHHVSKKIKKTRLSDCHFSMAKHFIYNEKSVRAIINIVSSIFVFPAHEQTKHKLVLIYQLFLKKKTEYNL